MDEAERHRDRKSGNASSCVNSELVGFQPAMTHVNHKTKTAAELFWADAFEAKTKVRPALIS